MIKFMLDYLPLIATALVMLCYIPQITKLKKEKYEAVKGMAWGYWVLINIALILMLINAITVFVVYGTFGYLIKEIFDVILCSTVLVLMIKYRKSNKV